MNVIKTRQHRFIERQRVAGGLDHEDDALVVDRQRVAAHGVGLDHVAAIGDENAGDAGIAGCALRAARAALIHRARNRAGGGCRHHGCGRRRERRRGSIFYDIAARGRWIAAAASFAECGHAHISVTGCSSARA
jgi:hypothetical protein